MTSNSGLSVLLARRMTCEWLRSTRGRRLLRLVATIHVVCLLAFLLFLPALHSWFETVLSHFIGRVIFGLAGAIVALSGIILVNAMRKYWDMGDSPDHNKKLWFWVITLGLNIGACAYCFIVYLPQRNSDTAG